MRRDLSCIKCLLVKKRNKVRDMGKEEVAAPSNL